MLFVAYIIGSLAEYEQDLGLYGSFTTLSGVLGWVLINILLKILPSWLQIIATAHVSCNDSVRHFVGQLKRKVCGCKGKEKGEREKE